MVCDPIFFLMDEVISHNPCQRDSYKNHPCETKQFYQAYTLQGTNISHLVKRKIIFKMPFKGDMLVPRRVIYFMYTSPRAAGRLLFFFPCGCFFANGIFRGFPALQKKNTKKTSGQFCKVTTLDAVLPWSFLPCCAIFQLRLRLFPGGGWHWGGPENIFRTLKE